jgi:hypothetical protein
MVTVTASTVLSKNGFTTTDFAAIDVENMIDDTIDTINLLADQTITAMAGTAGSKTATLTGPQNTCFYMLISGVLRENKKTALSNSGSTSGSSSINKSVNMGPISFSEGGSTGTAISATATLNNPANSMFANMFNLALRKLMLATVDPPIVVAYEPI